MAAFTEGALNRIGDLKSNEIISTYSNNGKYRMLKISIFGIKWRLIYA